jgi:predicted dehydrogenase
VIVPDLGEMLQLRLDAVVIATPNAFHAAQAVQALQAGAAVFCQKPLGRTAAEVRAVVEAARAADRLLGVDLSYRFTEGMQRIREYVAGGEIGSLYAADLVFHTERGPVEGWRHDPRQAGGGCVMDLGFHLVDLALWMFGFPAVERVSANLFAAGEPLEPGADVAEDHAIATITLQDGRALRIACSWTLPGGRDALVEAQFHGTAGSATFMNVNGAFHDFRAELHKASATEILSKPGDAWGGRAAARWAARVASGEGFDAEAERQVTVAEVLDRIYGR